MPEFKSDPTKVDLSRDRLAEMSDLAEQIYSHIRLMVHGADYSENREHAIKKCDELYHLLGRK